MGVNQLVKEMDVPLSTLQKYLDKQQTYFKKNHARKWVLPEMSAINDMADVSNNYSNIIDAQIMSMDALFNTLSSQFKATMTLIETQKPTTPPVAGNSGNVDPYMVEKDKSVKETYALFKKYLPVCPEEYQDIIKNVDLYKLMMELGTIQVNKEIMPELTSLFIEESTELSDNVVDILSEYQKEI